MHVLSGGRVSAENGAEHIPLWHQLHAVHGEEPWGLGAIASAVVTVHG